MISSLAPKTWANKTNPHPEWEITGKILSPVPDTKKKKVVSRSVIFFSFYCVFQITDMYF